MLVDSHAHLVDEQFRPDLDDVLQRAFAAGVTQIVNTAVDLPSSREAVASTARYPKLLATVGVHPHAATSYTNDVEQALAELAAAPEVVAVGEIGLDYYRDYSPRAAQRQTFERQLGLAERLGLPVVIHTRQAHEDLLAIIRDWRAGDPARRGVMHCYSGPLDAAFELIDLGFYISIAGPITYPNAGRLREVVAAIPLERLLIETDCPALPPVPHRGERNEPVHLPLIAQAIAEVRQVSLAEVIQATQANAAALFQRELGTSKGGEHATPTRP
ncbi:MAG: TatD family hydrolase [Chloroflexi bacterium]|nr:TatD family hydrolase [Chloroflexota bacterium]